MSVLYKPPFLLLRTGKSNKAVARRSVASRHLHIPCAQMGAPEGMKMLHSNVPMQHIYLQYGVLHDVGCQVLGLSFVGHSIDSTHSTRLVFTANFDLIRFGLFELLSSHYCSTTAAFRRAPVLNPQSVFMIVGLVVPLDLPPRLTFKSQTESGASLLQIVWKRSDRNTSSSRRD
jgi:hypothetical protein